MTDKTYIVNDQPIDTDALARELGIVGMVRFLQQFETGHGDYSKDRHNWLDNQDMDTVLKRIREKREADKKTK